MKVDAGVAEVGYQRIASTESFAWNSSPVPVESSHFCQASAWVVGFDGALGCAFVVLIFLDQAGKELQRKIALIDDFSGRAKNYTLRAPVPLRAKQVVVGYRVNSDLPSDCAPSTAKLWFRMPELRVLPQSLVEEANPFPPPETLEPSTEVSDPHPQFRLRPDLSKADLIERISGFKRWYHRVELLSGLYTPGVNDVYPFLSRLQLPEDCSGLRVLDIGTCDGFFSFVLEQRGAKEVIAIDHKPVEETGFPILCDILQSRVEFHQDNVYNLSVDRYGTFDIVLCLGLLYHLRNPLLGLEKVREVCTDKLYVESHVIDSYLKDLPGAQNSKELLNQPIMQFYPRDEAAGDYTNWWGPNSLCLRRMLEASNFSVVSQEAYGGRSILRCVVNEDQQVAYFRKIEKGLCG
ncbi:MAG: class I SAM-dependent methyltransferase [Acidobacteria bacterium]|nr:class I SAM-dependent methyltransferase [Acidobacteriota bacterium]